MAAWTPSEDKVLSDIIFDYMGRGVSIKDAIIKASKSLNKTIEACSSRWYNELQYRFKDVSQKIKSTVKRINEYVGDWSINEDERLTHLMIQLQIQNVGVSEALHKCSEILGRSYSGVSNRWYNYILKRNKLTISNAIEGGKKKMEEVKSHSISRDWSKENENIAVSIMFKSLRNGEVVNVGLKSISEKINVPLNRVRNYWYTHLLPEHREQVDGLRGVNKEVWDDEKKYKLFKFMTEAIEKGNGITTTIKDAADEFETKENVTHNMWYTYVRNNPDFKLRYENEKNELSNKEVEQTTSVDFTEQEDKTILDSVLRSIRVRRGMNSAFQSAANAIGKSMSEVESRWKKVLQYKYYNEITNAHENKDNKDIQEPVVIDVYENNKQTKQEQPEQPEIQEQVNPQQEVFIPTGSLDITKITDFVAMVQNLVAENQRLNNENSELKAKVSDYEEMEAKNKQIKEAFEKARQFLNFEVDVKSEAK